MSLSTLKSVFIYLFIFVFYVCWTCALADGKCRFFHVFFFQFNVKRGGQRVATMLMYLSDNVEGGETYFPKVFTISLAKLNFIAIIFFYEKFRSCLKDFFIFFLKFHCYNALVLVSFYFYKGQPSDISEQDHYYLLIQKRCISICLSEKKNLLLQIIS